MQDRIHALLSKRMDRAQFLRTVALLALAVVGLGWLAGGNQTKAADTDTAYGNRPPSS